MKNWIKFKPTLKLWDWKIFENKKSWTIWWFNFPSDLKIFLWGFSEQKQTVCNDLFCLLFFVFTVSRKTLNWREQRNWKEKLLEEQKNLVGKKDSEGFFLNQISEIKFISFFVWTIVLFCVGRFKKGCQMKKAKWKNEGFFWKIFVHTMISEESKILFLVVFCWRWKVFVISR